MSLHRISVIQMLLSASGKMNTGFTWLPCHYFQICIKFIDRGSCAGIVRHVDQLLLDYNGDVCSSVSAGSSSCQSQTNKRLCYQSAHLLSPCFKRVQWRSCFNSYRTQVSSVNIMLKEEAMSVKIRNSHSVAVIKKFFILWTLVWWPKVCDLQ